MKSKVTLTALVFAWLIYAAPGMAQDQAQPKHSNIGLKLNLGLGSQDFTRSQDWEKGEAASLSLGYGVSQQVTFWLGVQGSSHVHEQNPNLKGDLVGVELALQYKLRPYERLRPYGKIGLGGFLLGTEATDTVLNGNGITWAVGAEHRLTRFFTIGLELFWKDFDYTKIKVGNNGDFTDLDRPQQGNTRGLMLNFTLH